MKLSSNGTVTAHASNVVLRIRANVEAWTTLYALTQAEEHILLLVALGNTSGQIAAKRGVTRETLKSQTKTLLAKTTDDSVIRAALRCLRESVDN